MFGYENSYLDKSISVLIVDDDKQHNQNLSNQLVENFFFPVNIEDDPKKLIKQIEDFQPDILLFGLEYSMKNDNLSRKIWHRFRVPMIFIVKNDNNENYKKAFFSEPYGFLSKPLVSKDIKMTIEAAYYKHIHIENYVKQVIKPKSDFVFFEGGFCFDSNNLALYKHKEKINITKSEERLLSVLCEFSLSVAPIDIIFTRIYRDDFYNPNKLRTLIYRLRKKLDFDIFETYPNVGYRLKLLEK